MGQREERAIMLAEVSADKVSESGGGRGVPASLRAALAASLHIGMLTLLLHARLKKSLSLGNHTVTSVRSGARDEISCSLRREAPRYES